jgi:hypothetical protein
MTRDKGGGAIHRTIEMTTHCDKSEVGITTWVEKVSIEQTGAGLVISRLGESQVPISRKGIDCTNVQQEHRAEKKKFKNADETTAALLSAYFGAPLIQACVRVRGAS